MTKTTDNTKAVPLGVCPECGLWIFQIPTPRDGRILCGRCDTELAGTGCEWIQKAVGQILKEEIGPSAQASLVTRASLEGEGPRVVVEAHYGMEDDWPDGAISDRAHDTVLLRYKAEVPREMRRNITLLRLFN